MFFWTDKKLALSWLQMASQRHPEHWSRGTLPHGTQGRTFFFFFFFLFLLLLLSFFLSFFLLLVVFPLFPNVCRHLLLVTSSLTRYPVRSVGVSGHMHIIYHQHILYIWDISTGLHIIYTHLGIKSIACEHVKRKLQKHTGKSWNSRVLSTSGSFLVIIGQSSWSVQIVVYIYIYTPWFSYDAFVTSHHWPLIYPCISSISVRQDGTHTELSPGEGAKWIKRLLDSESSGTQYQRLRCICTSVRYSWNKNRYNWQALLC